MSQGEILMVARDTLWIIIKAALPFVGCWSDCQFISDIDIHSGTDADICTEALGYFYFADADWRMDCQFHR